MPRDAADDRSRSPRLQAGSRVGRRRARTAAYRYPQALRAAVEGLPTGAGVYIFHGEDERLPLYIGKSVNLRSRVLAHLRNPREAHLLRQTQRISHIRTAGEIGALLLEARLIKEQQPLHNRKLRRSGQLCSLQLVRGVPQVVYSRDVDFSRQPGLYGLFTSRHAALQRLEQIAVEHALCLGVLGLEHVAAGRPCFRALLRQCRGACHGGESRAVHDARLQGALDALRIACWPYPGSCGLVERDENGCQVHVIRNWCYLGSAPDVDQARRLATVAPGFDVDGYRILCGPILSGRVEMVSLDNLPG